MVPDIIDPRKIGIGKNLAELRGTGEKVYQKLEWVPAIKYVIKSEHWFYPGQTFWVKSTHSRKIATKQLKRIQELNKRKGYGNCKVTMEIKNSLIEKPTQEFILNPTWRFYNENR